MNRGSFAHLRVQRGEIDSGRERKRFRAETFGAERKFENSKRGTGRTRVRACLHYSPPLSSCFELASPSRAFGRRLHFLLLFFSRRSCRRSAAVKPGSTHRSVMRIRSFTTHKVYTCFNVSAALSACLNIGARDGKGRRTLAVAAV